MQRKKQIVLSEQDLHFLVENSVRQIINENGVQEGFWGGMKNVWNGVKSGNLNVGQTYRSGNLSSNFSQFANQASEAINGMVQIANNTNNKQIARYLNQVKATLEKTVNNFNAVANNVAQGNVQYNQDNNPYKMNNKQINQMGYNKMYNKATPKKA